MLSVFSCVYWSSVYLWKNVFRFSAHFLIELLAFLLLSSMPSLYFLDINSLSDVWFANIFFRPVGFLFTLLMVPFTAEKLLVWYSPICLFSRLLPLLLVSDPKNPHQTDVKEFATYNFIWEFYGFWSYIWVLIPFWINFWVWSKIVARFHLNWVSGAHNQKNPNWYIYSVLLQRTLERPSGQK